MLNNYKVAIKGMVCDRCILTVKEAFHQLNIPIVNISLGEVTTVSALSAPDTAALSEKLKPLGFTLLEDKKTKLVRDVRILVGQVYSGNYDFPEGFRFSDVVADALDRDYNTISNTFSESEHVTLEKYIIEYRVEKAKELLVYTDQSLADIADKLGFSSAAHLSRQFKSTTGLNSSYFRNIRKSKIALAREEEPSA
ncbi:helix-turn-helix domain-containing protein [Chitinophaga tropicalis]|uniref:Helix-turn-helix domain-containing protein n=1 Tax=Chitinophaga tropicalis TaxID=2683588 RepID=A0A7K1U0U4_9BACT|nr:helix-turn-helix domain-containing protein [Chitinophaga tropicalis]MVT07906.1 helix-turn-helix domain-containing protein [Chitinophaga tropicalis]